MLETNLEKGIQGDAADLTKRRNAFGSNTLKKKGVFLVNSLPIYIFALTFYFFIRAITLSFVEEENISYSFVLFCFVLDVSLISVTHGAFVSLQDKTLCFCCSLESCEPLTSFFLKKQSILIKAKSFLCRVGLLVNKKHVCATFFQYVIPNDSM